MAELYSVSVGAVFVLAMGRSETLEKLFGEGVDTAWEIFCIAVSFAGLFLRAAVVGVVPKDTSGRNTGGQLARSLNTTGMYSVSRNPIYLADFLEWAKRTPVFFPWRRN
ncbi:MAG: hypothetical protein HQL11_06975 [Candidatus Omnitrophica bacterium]|nr:hypothetical protein [Candidatus Omnitrophota bacterium]